jgi:two-component sensor histidine kinase
MKYAFRNIPDPLVQLRIVRQGDELILDYSDNGIGLPDSVGLNQSSGFGMQLIGLLVQQMDATIAVERNSGTRYVLRVKLSRRN